MLRGDNAIGGFRIGDHGRLQLVQEIIEGQRTLNGFERGNHLGITRDGLDVYPATRSGAVACLRRDSRSGELTRNNLERISI